MRRTTFPGLDLPSGCFIFLTVEPQQMQVNLSLASTASAAVEGSCAISLTGSSDADTTREMASSVEHAGRSPVQYRFSA